jgi:Helix-turn-helix domain of resolvase
VAQGCGHQQAGLGPPTPGGPQLFSQTTARALLKDPAIPVEEVTKRLQVSPATLYRHFPGGRSGLEEATG